MFLNKEGRQSARVMGHVLKFPLYDGDCSPAARALLADGDVDGAIAEWRRLADLGSGRARCVLAFLALKGTQSVEPDLEEARRLALSALSGERGYANYVLGCIAIKEKQPASMGQYLGESYKAGFVPAATLLASLTLEPALAPTKARSTAASLLRRASTAGHRPAQLFLCRAYLRGRLGHAQRLLGVCLLPIAMAKLVLSLKYQVFSVKSFYYSNRPGPIFAEAKSTVSASSGGLYVGVLGLTHVAAAILAAAVLLTHQNSTSFGWIALVMWPYGWSYLVASKTNGASLIGTVVQTLLLSLITIFVCSAYVGHLLDVHLSGWVIGAVTLAQAFLLTLACSFAAAASKRVEPSGETVPFYRLPIALAHCILGLTAAGSVFVRPAHSHLEYLVHYGFDVAGAALLALLPYVAAGLFAWRLVTANRWKPWAYLCVLVMGTAVAILNNSGTFEVQPGLLGVGLVVMVQFIAFGMVGEWALDGDPWLRGWERRALGAVPIS